MNPTWLIFIHIFYTQCICYIKQVTLTPQNPNQQGAQVIILESDEVTVTDSSWNILTLDEVGFHIQLSLEPLIWGFYPSNTKTSTIYITIDSSTPTPTPAEFMLSATVNNKYFTTLLRLSNTINNKVSPSCNQDIPPADPYLTGDVAALVSDNNGETRKFKATNGNQKVNLGNSNIGKDMNWPITFQFENIPDWNEMFFTVYATGWNNFDQMCLFEKFDHSMGFDL
eukprot:51350_1